MKKREHKSTLTLNQPLDSLKINIPYLTKKIYNGCCLSNFGKTFQPHQLALATLGSVVLLVLPKPWGPSPTTPPIKASSPEEEKFIQEWLAKHTEEKH